MLVREKFEYCQFSNTEKQVVQYILEHASEIEDLSIKEIAVQCFTVPSTLVRIAHKMGYQGWKELKDSLLEEEQYLNQHFFAVDANIPFEKNDSVMSIANKLAVLKKETLDDILSLIRYDQLQKAVGIMKKSDVIHIFSAGHNPLLAQKFQYDMERIHHHVIIHTVQNDFVYEAYALKSSDCALIISYTGETNVLTETIHVLKSRQLPVIAITSIGENTISSLSDCVLNITTREKLYSKIASYSTDESIIYILELLYSCLFQIRYAENMEEKTKIAKLTEKRKTIINQLIEEDS